MDGARASLASSTVPLHLVLGNESADADSLVSALAHALFLSRQQQQSRLVVPILSCPRADYPLRREASVIISRWLGGNASSLFFLDDAPSFAPTAEGAALTLVDHNRRKAKELAGWPVASIVDHHFDEGYHPEASRQIDFSAATMRGCGSCCSLIALNLLQQGQGGSLDAPLAEALLSVISMDTINMLPSKATELDAAAVAGLLGVLRGELGEDKAPTVAGLFSSLNALRSDRQWWLSLEPRAALGLDWKSWDLAGGGRGALGTCALMLGASDFLQGGRGARGQAPVETSRVEAALALARERGCCVLAIMSQVVSPAVEREVVFLPGGGEGAEEALQTISQALRHAPGAADFELEEIKLLGAPPGAMAFVQKNSKHTRKTMAPWLVAVLEKGR